MEAPEERLLVFTLAESSFMRDFEGRWQVGPSPISSAASGVQSLLVHWRGGFPACQGLG